MPTSDLRCTVQVAGVGLSGQLFVENSATLTWASFMSLLVSLKSKTPFLDINGELYCLWEYQLTDQSTSDGFVARLEGLLGLGVGSGAASASSDTPIAKGAIGQVGLGFSKRLSIRDPAWYADVAELRGTHLVNVESDALQFVYLDAPETNTGSLDIHLVAPCAEDLFTPISLVGTDSQGNRQALQFRTDPEGTDNTVQFTRGTAMICTDQPSGTTGRPAADFIGTLPYASEIFGVYPPLAGWLDRRTTQRVANTLAIGRSTAPAVFFRVALHGCPTMRS